MGNTQGQPQGISTNDPRRRQHGFNPVGGPMGMGSNDPRRPMIGPPQALGSNDPMGIGRPNNLVMNFIRQLRGIDRIHGGGGRIGPPRRMM